MNYRMIWMWAFAAVFALGFAAAHAAPVGVTATVTITAPTTRTDGTALPASQIAGYRLKWGTATGTYPNVVSIPADGSPYAWTATLEIPVGTTRTVFYVATAVDADGRESGNSAEAKKSFSLLSDAVPTSPGITLTGWTCAAPSGFKCVVLP